MQWHHYLKPTWVNNKAAPTLPTASMCLSIISLSVKNPGAPEVGASDSEQLPDVEMDCRDMTLLYLRFFSIFVCVAAIFSFHGRWRFNSMSQKHAAMLLWPFWPSGADLTKPPGPADLETDETIDCFCWWMNQIMSLRKHWFLHIYIMWKHY